jgi:hypothetical protein
MGKGFPDFSYGSRAVVLAHAPILLKEIDGVGAARSGTRCSP